MAIVEQAPAPFQRRTLHWDLSQLPVPAELLIYTRTEWQQMQAEGGRFVKMLTSETVWVFPEDRKG